MAQVIPNADIRVIMFQRELGMLFNHGLWFIRYVQVKGDLFSISASIVKFVYDYQGFL